MHSTSQTMFMILCGIFVTALVIADIIGSKLFVVGPFDISLAWIPLVQIPKFTVHPLVLSAGIIPFPLTFVLTDLINEFYGKKGAKFVTFLGLGMAIFAAGLIYAARLLPTSPNSPLPDGIFNTVFGMSNRIFIASLCAYIVGQLLDINVFHALRHLTQEKMLWLRSTGSTVVSQLIDSIIVAFIAFSGKLPVPQITEVAINNYGVKFLIAVGLTPICYLGHAIIHNLLAGRPGQAEPEEMPLGTLTEEETTLP